ncbi:MAG: NAD-dependent epimerase/dehydratase family protein, partial [Angustibacter sp.]
MRRARTSSARTFPMPSSSGSRTAGPRYSRTWPRKIEPDRFRSGMSVMQVWARRAPGRDCPSARHCRDLRQRRTVRSSRAPRAPATADSARARSAGALAAEEAGRPLALVVGAGGLVGRHVVRAFADAGHEVHAATVPWADEAESVRCL